MTIHCALSSRIHRLMNYSRRSRSAEYTACHWTSWSTTPAFIIDLGTGRTTDMAVYDQRPIVSRRRSKNLDSLP